VKGPETIEARIARLQAELARLREIEARNTAKATSYATRPASRWAYASQATKARNRAARVEGDLYRLRRF
jgi:hypothetical protein